VSPGKEQPSGAAPRVSVLMSVYNCAPYLQQSIDSILAQSFGDFEFIIIDDGSNDGSSELIEAAASRDERIRAFSNPGNLALSRSLNRGLALARGRYIARHDADDVSAPDRLAQQVALLEADASLSLIGSAYWLIDSDGVLLGMEQPPQEDVLIRWRMLFHSALAHPTVMFRSDLFACNHLRYDENLRYAQDYELWSRATEYGHVANCAAPLLYYRVYDEARRTEMHREQQQIATGIAKKNLARLGLQLKDHEVEMLRGFHSGVALPVDEAIHCQRLVQQIMCLFIEAYPGAASKLARTRIHLAMTAWSHPNRCASYLEAARISWGYFRLGPLSFLQCVFAIYLSRMPLLLMAMLGGLSCTVLQGTSRRNI